MLTALQFGKQAKLRFTVEILDTAQNSTETRTDWPASNHRAAMNDRSPFT